MIRTENLCKSYGRFAAVKNLNLQIDEGKVFGFIGPNGAGKSTTMLILATLLAPTSGAAWVGGYNVVERPEEVRRLVGYMPDFFGVYDQLKVTEYLDFYAGAYRIPAAKRAGLIADLLELVNLSHKADSYVDSLSRGMKQRLGLARCLIHDPQVLILDEPASGLDPRARIEMREILKELRKLGKTILISSHILPELAEICDEIGVIEKGELIAHSPVGQMSLAAQGWTVLEVKVLDGAERAREILNGIPSVKHVDLQQRTLRLQFSGGEKEQADLLQRLVAQGIPVVRFGRGKENLEDVFLAITGGGNE
ncbi:ABC transporter ATP-binding protein [Bacillaceae bacterium]